MTLVLFVEAKKNLTPVEEVEEYVRMEATKEKASRIKKIAHPALLSLFPFCTQYPILEKFNKIENSLQSLVFIHFLIVLFKFSFLDV